MEEAVGAGGGEIGAEKSETSAIVIGEESFGGGDVGETAFVDAQDKGGADAGMAGAFDGADEDLIEGGGHESDLQIRQDGGEDFGKIGEGELFITEDGGHIFEQIEDGLPKLFMEEGFFGAMIGAGVLMPAGEGERYFVVFQEFIEASGQFAAGIFSGAEGLEAAEAVLPVQEVFQG
jgi:hypothetical protein